MKTSTRSGFGYRIDYDKEIAEDLARIASHEHYLKIAETFAAADLATFPNGLTLLDYLWHEETRLSRWQALTGLELEDLRCCMDYVECEYPGLGSAESSDWYWRGERACAAAFKAYGTCDAFERIHPAEQQIGWLRKARASLSRHRRNKEKYGHR
jgi:hypothetical protein